MADREVAGEDWAEDEVGICVVEDDLVAGAGAGSNTERGRDCSSGGSVAYLQGGVGAGELDAARVDGAGIGDKKRIVRAAEADGGVGEVQDGPRAFHADEIVFGASAVADEGVSGDSHICAAGDGEGIVRAKIAHAERSGVGPCGASTRDCGGVVRRNGFMANTRVAGDQ